MGHRLLLCAAVLLCACPPPAPPVVDAGPVDAGAPVISPVELCERVAAARCGLFSRCYTAFARFEQTQCAAAENARCLAEYETLRPSFEAELVHVDARQLAACEVRMQTSACPPSFPPSYPVAVAQPFVDCALQTGLLAGAVAAGETCERAVECAPGTVCMKQNGVCRGVCSSLPKEGERCAFGCGPGLRCEGDTCVALRAVNEPCATTAECASDLICQGSCRPRRKLGETCGFDQDRLSQCEPGLACDVVPFVSGAVGTCVTPRKSGETCRFHWSCEPGLVCADLDWTPFPAAAPVEGSCRKPDGRDFNCLPTQYGQYVGSQCASGLTCRVDTRKCQALPKQGEACTPSLQDCDGLNVFCKPSGAGDNGTCTGPAAQGDQCAFSVDATRTVSIPCSSGFCDAETTQLCRPPSLPLGSTCKEDGQCLSGRCAVQQDRTLRCAPAC
jgi:hypothetical protein